VCNGVFYTDSCRLCISCVLTTFNKDDDDDPTCTEEDIMLGTLLGNRTQRHQPETVAHAGGASMIGRGMQYI